MRATRTAALVSGASLLALSAAWSPGAVGATVATLPTGGQFVAGAGTIGVPGKGGLSINQTSTRGIINWQSFSIGQNKTVNINNGSGATLNRVTGSDPSKIAGRLNATGSVYVINTAGVIVTPTGKVFASGDFVASTRDVSNSAFMAGGTLNLKGTSTGDVVNQGTISSANGDVVLIGKSVTNNGKISAANGQVSLAAGDNVLLQDGANETVQIKAGNGDTTNTGTIEAAQVQLAAADGNVYALATNNGGIIRATGTATKDGHVYLTADGDVDVGGTVSAVNASGGGGRIAAIAGRADGKLTVHGTIDADATKAGKGGGRITLTASSINIGVRARVSAEGTANGGNIFIGGDRHGGTNRAEDLSTTPIANATTTTIQKGAVIDADGGSQGGKGKGGNVVVWSNGVTNYQGSILARGGKSGGDGGFVEVSGEGLAFHGKVNTNGPKGASGTLLIDPSDVTIFSSTDQSGNVGAGGNNQGVSSGPTYDPTTGTSYILNTDIDALLASNDVVINTGSVGDGLGGSGNIHFGNNNSVNGSNAAPIYWTSNHSLTLNAIGTIDTIGGAPTSATGTAAGAGALAAATAGLLIDAAGGGSITLNAAIGGGLSSTAAAITISPDIEAHGGTITLASKSADNFIIDSGNVTNSNGGQIVFSSDKVRLGAGHTYIGSVQTDGNVIIEPFTTNGPVLVGNNYASGNLPDDDLQNTALINADSIKVIHANTLIIGNSSVTDLTIGSPVGIDPLQNPTPYPGIFAQFVSNLEFVTGASGSVTQDARTSIAVGNNGDGGLGVITGGKVSLPDFLNAFSTLAVSQLSGGAGGSIVVQTAGFNGDNTGTLAIGAVNDIAGINAPNATVTLINIGATTQDTTSPNSKIVAANLVLEGGAAGNYESYLDFNGDPQTYAGAITGSYALNNTSNQIGKVVGAVSSLSLANNANLTVAANISDQLAGASTGSGNAIASTNYSGIAASGDVTITANGVFTIASGGTISTTGGNVRLEAGSPNYGDGTVNANTGFVNNDATGINVTGGGNWRIYSQDPRNDSYGSLVNSVTPNYAFVQYGAANYYGDPTGSTGSGTSASPSPFSHANSVLAGNYSGSGNGFLYTVAPTASESLTTVFNKVYDGTTAVVPSPTGTDYSAVGGTINGDVVVLSHPNSATYDTRHVGNSKTVTASGISLVSAEDANGVQVFGYKVTTTATGTGKITAKALTLSGLTGVDKIYDGTDAAQILGTPTIGSEATGVGNSSDGKYYTVDSIGVSGTGAGSTFDTRHVGSNKAITVAGYSLTGNSFGDYTLSAVIGVTANITAKVLTITGLTGVDKIYDGTNAATVTGTAALSSEATGVGTSSDGKYYTVDSIGLSGSGTGSTFADRHVGNNKAITLGGYSLTGNTFGDYTLSSVISATANITAKALTFGGLSGVDKVYDGTTAATLSGTAALTGSEATGVGNSSDGKWYTVDSIGLSGSGAGSVFNTRHVGTGKAITVNGYALTGNSFGDYTLTPLVGVTANITAKALTFGGLTANDKIYDGTTGATLSGTAALTGSEATGVGNSSDGKWYTVDSIGITGSGAGSVFNTRHVGTGKAVTVNGYSLTGNGFGDYTLTPLVGLTANITAKALTFGGLTGVDKVYDGTTAATLAGTAALTGSEATGVGNSSDGKWYTVDSIGLSGSGAGSVFNTRHVGTGKAITVNGYALTGNTFGDYTLTPLVGVTANITAKALTFGGLTANDKIYDGTTVATLTGTAALTGSEATGVGSSSDGKWYTVDSIGLSGSGAGSVFNTRHVGTGKAVTVNGYSLTGNSFGDYTLTPLVGLTANITAKALTVNGLAALSKVYDGTTAATVTGTPTLGNEAAGAGTSSDGKYYTVDSIGLTGTASGTFSQKNVGNGLSVSAGGLSLTGNSFGDYTLTPLITLTANITPKALTVTGDKVYDGNTGFTTGELTITGAVAGETVSLTSGTGTSSSKNVGTYNGSTLNGLGLHVTGGLASNYILPATGKLVITPKALTITADNQSKIYGDLFTFTGNSSEFAVSGLVSGDSVTSASLSSAGAAKTADVAGSPYNIAISGASGTGLGNYSITYKVGHLTVTPAALTITAVDQSRVYGSSTGLVFGTNQTTDYTVVGLKNGQTVGHVNLSVTGASTAVATDVGTLANAITAGGAGGGTFNAANYNITYVKGDVKVTPKTLVVTANNQSKIYGDTFTFTGNPSEFTVTGLVTANGDSVTGASLSSPGAAASADVGHSPYVINISGATGNRLSNYNIVYHTGQLTVTPRSIDTAIVVTGQRYYDGTANAPASILKITNLANGDQVGLSGTGIAAGVDVGTWSLTSTNGKLTGLTLTGKDKNNYTTQGGSGTLKILPLPIILHGTRIYDGTTSGNASILDITNLIGSDDVTLVAGGTSTIASEHVGDRNIIDFTHLQLAGGKADDYTLVGAKGDVIVTPLPVIMTGTRVYDGLTDGNASILHITNAIDGDDVSILQDGGTSTISSKHVGDRTIIDFGTLKLDNNPHGDYTLVGAKGTVIVTPLPIDGTSTRPYNGGDGVDGGIITVTNAPPGDSVTLTGTGTSDGPHKGNHTVDPGGLTIVGGPGTDPHDYTTTGGNITVDITPIPVILLGTRVYDGLTDGDGSILAVTNAIPGDTVDVSGGTSTIASKNVGHEGIVDFGTLTLGNNPNGDYTLVGATGTVIVTPLHITVQAVPDTKTYDGTTTSDKTPIVIDGKIVTGDTGDFIQTFGDKNAGNNVKLTPSGTVDDGNGGKNYIITYEPITIGGVIKPRPVTVDGTRPFDGQTDAKGDILTVDGAIPGDVVVIASGTGVLGKPDVGNEPIVDFGTLTLGGADAGNYFLASGNVLITANFTPPPQNQNHSGDFDAAFDSGILSLTPKQNGIVTGTIATNDGQDDQPDTQLGCTLGDTGCLQNGVGTGGKSSTPAK